MPFNFPNLFNNPPANPAAATPPANPPVDPNVPPATPPAQATPPAPAQEPTGLAKFASLVQNNTNSGDGDPAAPKQPLNVPGLFQDETFVKSLQSNIRASIQQGITQETREKLAANDPQALLSVIQDTATAAYMQALQHSAHLQGMSMEDQLEQFSGRIEDQTNQAIGQHALVQQMPQLNNPVVQLGVNAVIESIRSQNPQATPQDIQTQVTEYLGELGKAFGAVPSEDPQQVENPDGQPADFDWLKDLGIDDPLAAPPQQPET